MMPIRQLNDYPAKNLKVRTRVRWDMFGNEDINCTEAFGDCPVFGTVCHFGTSLKEIQSRL